MWSSSQDAVYVNCNSKQRVPRTNGGPSWVDEAKASNLGASPSRENIFPVYGAGSRKPTWISPKKT